MAALQCYLLWSIVESRAEILRNGEEVTLKTVPVDPRSLLRGRYVRLDYDISRVEIERFQLPNQDEQELVPKTVYVVLKSSDGNHASVQRVYFEKPEVLDPDQIYIKAKLNSQNSLREFRRFKNVPIDYGISRFYVPETDALAIEESYRDDKIPVDVVIAVDAAGTPQLKRLIIDGKQAYEEPIY